MSIHTGTAPVDTRRASSTAAMDMSMLIDVADCETSRSGHV